jgi:hypothetical protein
VLFKLKQDVACKEVAFKLYYMELYDEAKREINILEEEKKYLIEELEEVRS